MYWPRRMNKVTGAVLLLLPMLSILGFLVGIQLGELDPFARGDIEELLETINDNRSLYFLSLTSFVVQDMLVVPLTAALLFLAFRDRSQALSLVWVIGMAVAVACFAAHEVGVLTLAFLADDFVEGGPSGIASGDPVVLEAARAVSVAQGSTALMAQTATGLSLAALGMIIGWSPSGRKVPPPWLGYLGLTASLCYLATWTFFLNHDIGGVFTLVGELAIIVMMTVLGIWFLREPEAPIAAKPAPGLA
jgi:hypothetical protein